MYGTMVPPALDCPDLLARSNPFNHHRFFFDESAPGLRPDSRTGEITQGILGGLPYGGVLIAQGGCQQRGSAFIS